MNKTIVNHYIKYFEQKYSKVYDLKTNNTKFEYSLVLFNPTEKYPYYKLCTCGLSEFVMPFDSLRKDDARNEFIIFFDKDTKIDDNDEDFSFFKNVLKVAVTKEVESNEFISYGHDIRYNYFNDSNMNGILLMFPEMFNTGLLRCNIGFKKSARILLLMPITNDELSIAYEKDGHTLIHQRFLYGSNKAEWNYLAKRNR